MKVALMHYSGKVQNVLFLFLGIGYKQLFNSPIHSHPFKIMC